MLYYDYAPLPKDAEEAVGCRRVENLDEFLGQCDVITVNTPLHADSEPITQTHFFEFSTLTFFLGMTHSARGMINKEFLSKMKKGSWLINTARGALAVAEDVAESLEAGHINYYGGDVWYPQPAPPDHPWRKMRNPLGGGNGQSQLLDHPDLEFDWLTPFGFTLSHRYGSSHVWNHS